VSGVRFALLGTLMLDGGAGNPVVVPGVRQRALLASLLLSANAPVSCDALAEAVRERFHAQLMEALARAGRRAEALDAYRQARRALVEEPGIEPGPHLRLLHQQILDGDPALAVPPASLDGTSPSSPPAAGRASGSSTGRRTKYFA
jgi:DNA-binding SARP family transcriptional activator